MHMLDDMLIERCVCEQSVFKLNC